MRSGLLMIIFWIVTSTVALGAPSNLTLRLLVDNPRPYVGQAFILSLEFSYEQLPTTAVTPVWGGLDNVILTDLPPLLPRREEHNGHHRIVETTRKLAYPLTSEKITVTLTAHGGSDIPPPAPLIIHPRPLPQRGRPANFSGAVVSAARLKVNSAASGTREVVVTLAGRGNLSAVELIAPLHYGDRLTLLSDELIGRAKDAQVRRQRYLYQPWIASRQPEFLASVFDPVTARYQLLRTTQRSSRWPTVAITVTLLLVAGTLGIVIRRRPRCDLNQQLTRLLGVPPHSLTDAQFDAALERQKLSPEMIRALQQERRATEERFARGAVRERPSSPLATTELARKLAMEIDKRSRLP
ncbi:MAG: hypothetical protein P1P74_09650 [Desulfuromonadales bacterium]|nr:hypothetical protein [Desulfuromonadales bacterium]